MWMPQRIAAVPAYIASQSKVTFAEAAPGHKFLGYLRNTQGANGMAYAPYKGKAKIIGNPPNGPPKRDANAEQKAEFDGVLNEVCDKFPVACVQQINALRSRQQALIAHHGDDGYRISTTSTAPFATGLGNEHPIENGFAFLTPYGLPYLAGSGVKGILRHAAEDLTLENDNQSSEGWTWVDVWWLFGFEGQTGKDDKGSIWDEKSTLGQAFARDLERTAAHLALYPLIARLFASDKRAGARFLDQTANGALQFLQACCAGKSLRGGLQARGALDFWDVFPKPAGDKLVVEIMTPHFGEYYRGNQTPHDSGAPVPVSFLAIPTGSGFDFHVACHTNLLPDPLQQRWRKLLDAAFAHAFTWVGFGAKTSVGYGAMKVALALPVNLPVSVGVTSPASPSSRPNQPSANSQTDGQTGNSQTWPSARLTLNASTGEVTAHFDGKSTAPLKNPVANDLRAALGEERANKLKKNKEVKGVSIEVEPLGKGWQLKSLTPT